MINDDSSFVVGGSPSTDWGGTSQGSPTPRPSQNSQITQGSQASQASSVGHKLRKKGAGTGAWNTPIARTETSAQTFGFEDKTAKSRNLRLGEVMKGRMLGPIPVDKFLAQFLSADKVSFDDMPEPKGAFRDVLKQSDNITNETGIYAPLVRTPLSLRLHFNTHCYNARSERSMRTKLLATSEALGALVSPSATRRTTQTSRAASLAARSPIYAATRTIISQQ